jgi:hypothetical protein
MKAMVDLNQHRKNKGHRGVPPKIASLFALNPNKGAAELCLLFGKLEANTRVFLAVPMLVALN